MICTHTSTGGVVDEQYCIAVKPDESVTCNETKCPKWEEGNWSQVNQTKHHNQEINLYYSAVFSYVWHRYEEQRIAVS